MLTSSPPTSAPGTDKPGMDFRRILPEIRCQSCLSPGSEPTPRGAFSPLSPGCPLSVPGLPPRDASLKCAGEITNRTAQSGLCVDRYATHRAGPSHYQRGGPTGGGLSLIHISEPTRLGMISYAVFCLK